MLSAASKVDLILDAWLQFITLEDRSKAKVPSDTAECDGLKLIGNDLIIDKRLFTKLQASNALGKRGQQEATWVVSFPQIDKKEQGKSNLYPLFSLDVTPIFRGSYQAAGWNIENFEVAEAGNNLAAFLNLEDEQLEKLITKEGLRRFLATTFDIDFESFEGWMQRVNLSGYCSISRQPYLFEFKSSNFSINLKQDLKAIQESQDKQWLESGHPAYEYLFGIPHLPEHQVSYLGAFLTHPPTDSQLEALKHAQSEPITTVQGPPGSGKTTLILHLIAQQVVKRALSLIETGEDINNLTVVSSTINRAVENVIERLSDDLADSLFYLNGGSKTAIERAGGAKEQLQRALAYLQESSFDENHQRSLALQIKQLKQELVDLESNYHRKRQQRQADEARQPQARQEIQALQRQVVEADTTRGQLERRAADLAHYEHLPENAYQQIRLQFNVAQLELSERTPPWWIRWLYWLLGRTERQILAKMALRCQAAIQQTLGTSFKMEPPTDRSALYRQSQRIDEGLTRLQELRTVRSNLQRISEAIISTNGKCEEGLRELSAIESRLANPFEDFYSTFHTQYHEQHQNLFDLSRQFLVQEALRRKASIEAALRLYLKVLPGETERAKTIRRMSENLDEHLKALSLMFPVITCTLLSIRNMLPWIDECVDRVIVDESGMIPLQQTFPLLVRTRKAIVVGDPLQIEPIMDQSQQTLDNYFQKAFNERGLTQEDYYRYSPDEIDTATTYHRAAGVSGRPDDPGQRIQLVEHYRCQPNIIAFCDRIASYGLIPKTEPKDSLLGPNLIAYHVEGNMIAKENREEITAIHEVIQHLVNHGYSPEEIGVISAFRAQADALIESLPKQFPQLKNAIGTVHKFQGSERRVIILSTKVCRRQDSVAWLNRRPNLLNVAVSRARELFILVGNLHRLEEAGVYTRRLVEHIREHGVILEYKTSTEIAPEQRSSPGSSLIYDCDHLGIFEEALREAEQELYVVAPQIRGSAADKFSKDVTTALKRGVNVTVIYGSSDSGNSQDEDRETQAEKELKKLFVKHPGGSLIRLSGEGTNERILVCDRKFAVVGSWNWLSHVYLTSCQKQQVTEEVQIRRETSVRLSESSSIQSVRETITELIQESLEFAEKG